LSKQTGESVVEPRAMECPSNAGGATGRMGAEAAARRELELLARRSMSDAEWASAKARLVDLIQVLRESHQSRTVQAAARPLSACQHLPDAA